MIQFIVTNWLALAALAVGAAALIVKATPTKTDDEILAKVEDALAKLGVKIPS